jgi:transposase
MSLWPRPGYEVPALTERVAFPRGSLAIRIRDALGEVFVDKEFADLFTTRGHPSTSPARLVMVSVLQFAEGLTDRQAAEADRGRVDWKFLLGLPLEDPGFDASVLSEFRTRLTSEDGQTDRLLTLLLRQLREHGLLERGGRQRCPCRIPRPYRSRGVLVLVEEAAEAVAAAYVETRDLLRVGDRRGQAVERASIRDALVRPVPVAELPGLPQGVQQVGLVPDQRAVQ